jgi:hypothetical protein
MRLRVEAGLMGWLRKECIDPALTLKKEQRALIYGDAWRLWSADPWNAVLYVFVLLLSLVLAFIVGEAVNLVLGRSAGAGFPSASLIATVIAFVLFGVIGASLLQRFRFRACVYRALRERGYEVCLRCGYWPRDLPEDLVRCPECGCAWKLKAAPEDAP